MVIILYSESAFIRIPIVLYSIKYFETNGFVTQKLKDTIMENYYLVLLFHDWRWLVFGFSLNKSSLHTVNLFRNINYSSNNSLVRWVGYFWITKNVVWKSGARFRLCFFGYIRKWKEMRPLWSVCLSHIKFIL